VSNDPSVMDSKTEFGYQAGIGFEFVLTKPSLSGGTLIFFKAGTNRPFQKKTFNFDGFKYDAGFNYGQWMITAGFKFFTRK